MNNIPTNLLLFVFLLFISFMLIRVEMRLGTIILLINEIREHFIPDSESSD
jgi:hypothetical protein